jgi:small subunit ribosomal protein S6
MPLYEHVFLARQDISTQQVEGLVQDFRTIIETGGGTIGKTEYWGLKGLTFRIKKNRKAHFSLMNIDAPPAAVTELERQMRLSTDIIRFLTVRVDEHEAGPSPMMRRADRDDREGRGDRGDRFDRGDRGDRFDRGDRGDRGDRRGPRRDRDRDFVPREPQAVVEDAGIAAAAETGEDS